jgi:outer membrane protein assembly factor BamB
MKTLARTLLVMAVASGAARAGDWTGFRGTNGASSSADKNLPEKWDGKENIRWRATLPGRGLSNPIFLKGKIYVTACSGYKHRKLHVLCFDEATGRRLWERQLSSTGNPACHPMTSMAAPTPVTDGEAVYALFATGDLAAFGLDGTLRWYRSIVGDYPGITNQVGMAASPVVHKGVVLLPMENAGESFAAGIDAKTGKNRWKVARPREINWVTPVLMDVGGQAQAIFCTEKDLTAYDPLTGKTLWTMTDVQPASAMSPTHGGGLLYVPGREFLALKLSRGGRPEVVWKSNKLGGHYASPTYYEGRIYALTGVGLRCVDAMTGKELWTQRVRGKFWASPVLADGKAYVTEESGLVTVIKLGEKPEVLAENRLGEKLLATPAVVGGAIYLRSDEALYRVGAK